MDVEKQDRTT